MAEFLRVPVGALVASGEAKLKTGPFGTQLKASDYTKRGTPVINVRNIGFGNIKADKLEFISPSTRDRLSSHILRNGDIVFGRKGAVERHVFIRQEQNGWFQGSDCLRLRFASQRVEPLFASYYFLTLEHQRWMMNQCSHGATMASLNQGVLERIELPLPPLPVQQRIAGILSAYDELIENSQRRIKILEVMAQALYREWFVHFRFPGHKNHPRVASPLGEIPQGWEVKKLGEICIVTDYVANGSFASLKENVKYRDEPDFAILIRGTDFNSGWNGKYVYVTEGGYRFLRKSELCSGDIVVTNVGNVGTTFFIPDLGKPMTLGPNSVLVRPHLGANFVFHYLRSDEGQHRIRGITSGVAQPKFNKTEFRSLNVVTPPKGLLQQFDSLVAPIHAMSEKLRASCANLHRTRDLLLPRLLSGQIDVTLPEP